MRQGVILFTLLTLPWALGACSAETVGLPATGGRDAGLGGAADAPVGGGVADAALGQQPDAAAEPVDAAPALDAATGADAASAVDAGSGADAPPTGTTTLRQCTGRAFPKHPAGDFDHLGSDLISTWSVEHAGYDVLTVAGGTVTGQAKLEYGPIFKDLEDEWVRVYLDDCTGWNLLGQVKTNSDGRVSWDFGVLEPGIYDVRWEVVGDATTAPAQLWVLPAGTHVTVYDIDGTLTTGDFELLLELMAELISGDYVPDAYPSAVEMTEAYRDLGEVGVYITGRPYYLTRLTREWLEDLHFVRGPLFLARDNGEAVPTNGGVGDFKLETLMGFDAAGFIIDTAQGNATTDIYAYLGAGIPASKVWIIGSHRGESGTQPADGTWAPHVLEIDGWPLVEQPFEW